MLDGVTVADAGLRRPSPVSSRNAGRFETGISTTPLKVFAVTFAVNSRMVMLKDMVGSIWPVPPAAVVGWLVPVWL